MGRLTLRRASGSGLTRDLSMCTTAGADSGRRTGGTVRGVRTAAGAGVGLLVGSALTALVLAPDSEPPVLPRLPEKHLATDPAVELPYDWSAAGTDGCDGYTVPAPVAQDAAAGTADSAIVLLSPRPDPLALNVVCFGATEDVGSAQALVLQSTRDPRARVVERVVGPLGTALRTDSTMGAQVLTEWWSEHEGATWGVGLLHDPDDTASVRTVEAMLATWRWS